MNIPLVAGAGVLGLMIGSFLNVCISRIPAGESVVSPGSRCPNCRKAIAAYDNIPILSYLILGGKCRRCGFGISVKYPIVEAVTAMTFAAQAAAIGEDYALLASRLYFTASLIILFGTDIETMRLPNVITFPGIAIGLVGSLWLPPGIVACLFGAALGAALPWFIRWLWLRIRGVDAMGLGDVKMLAMIGAFLGWRQVWVVLFFASFAGAVVGVTLIALGRRGMSTKLPFGTFLALAAFAASLWGEPLLAWYLQLYQ